MSEILQVRLLDALNERDLAAVTRCLRDGADPNDLTQDVSPMHKAAALGFVLGLQELHRAGGHIDLCMREGQRYAENTTPLMIASSLNQVEAGRWLLDHGADEKRCNTRSDTALCCAIGGQRKEFVDLLLRQRPGLRAGQLDASATKKLSAEHPPSVALQLWLLDLGANPNLTDRMDDPWLVFVQRKYWVGDENIQPVVADLVRRGADLNRASNTGVTPLLQAIGTGRADVLLQLLQAGADPDLTGSDHRTPRKIIRASKAKKNQEVREAFEAWDASQKAHQVMGKMPVKLKPI